MLVEEAKALVAKWADRFGFPHYRIRVRALPKRSAPRYWGTVHVDHEEEFIVVDLPVGHALPRRQLEYLVVHELTHCLIALANTSEHAEEVVCNRIAKAVLGRIKGPREWAYKPNKDYEDLDGHKAYSRGAALLEALPEQEAYVLSRLIWGRASLRQVSDELGLSRRQVARIRRRALDGLMVTLAGQQARENIRG